MEAIDDWTDPNVPTQYLEQQAASIVNKVQSPDVWMSHSMNPYAGCEHGCIYCYARNTHEYWGYSAGLDFERKIIVKINAPSLLRKFLMNPKWQGAPIVISGNTDCYQPAEQKFRLTRKLLEVCNEFNQPVAMITKNAWILRDKDLLAEMAKKNLVSVMMSTTSLQEDLRRIMEPRTATAAQKMKVIRELSEVGVKMGVLMGPVIPGLNDHEIPSILKTASENGAGFSAYTFIRLNGSIKLLFHDWLLKNFPDRADKVWHQIEQSHNGKVNDSQFGRRMRGEGKIAEMISRQFETYSKIYKFHDDNWQLNSASFQRPGQQGVLF